jgi:hypothetical protein
LLLLFAVTGLELWMVCHCGLQWFSRVDYSSSSEASLAIDYPVTNPMFPSW